LTLGGVVLTVNGDGAVVERQLAGGELGCPLCGGVLGGWGYGRERRVRMLAGLDVLLVPRRSRCRGCGATHVLLPAWCLSRRADAGAVIGAALEAAAAGAGFRKVAERLGRPVSTVRGWLRRFAGRAGQVREFFTVLLARISPDPVMPAGAASLVAAAVSAVVGAAAAVAQRWPAVGVVPVWAAASAASGGLLLAPGWPPAGRNAS
jgi:Homeodomain-like domain